MPAGCTAMASGPCISFARNCRPTQRKSGEVSAVRFAGVAIPDERCGPGRTGRLLDPLAMPGFSCGTNPARGLYGVFERRNPYANASENLFNVCGGSIDSYLAVCSIQRPNPYTRAERSTASLSGLEARFRHAVTEARAGPAN